MQRKQCREIIKGRFGTIYLAKDKHPAPWFGFKCWIRPVPMNTFLLWPRFHACIQLGPVLFSGTNGGFTIVVRRTRLGYATKR